ncbi:hypothetical protein COT42_03015 [Candidatus Saganbacteria bacterium CG08_land_8_20_14_0_20_45_16]|uniref:Uncharacterized protein n=1 Tax=Candidatus Saganbacteria bacterium CG08_land_8_20_14_0_20_45_16 TaxID=2014293 RepID=A0A2H0XZD3_UNCSA|nr:MAG: hypothetical protein COT42_03015 [Candidatus Saganbacteria bacterium CG08_land_8_20_14_0_20_45_16]
MGLPGPDKTSICPPSLVGGRHITPRSASKDDQPANVTTDDQVVISPAARDGAIVPSPTVAPDAAAAATPQSPPENAGAPNRNAMQTAGNLFYGLAQRELSGDELSSVNEEFNHGGHLNRYNFNRHFGTHMTRDAWRALTHGRERIDSWDEMNGYLREFEDFSRATGISFRYWSQCGHIVTVNQAALGRQLEYIQDAETIVRNNWQLLMRVMSFILPGNNYEGELNDVEHEPDRSAREEAVIQSLIHDFTTEVQGDPHRRELLAMALFNQLEGHARRENGVRLDRLGLQDPVVAERFARTQFNDWIMRSDPNSPDSVTRDEARAVRRFSRDIEGLRSMRLDGRLTEADLTATFGDRAGAVWDVLRSDDRQFVDDDGYVTNRLTDEVTSIEGLTPEEVAQATTLLQRSRAAHERFNQLDTETPQFAAFLVQVRSGTDRAQLAAALENLPLIGDSEDVAAAPPEIVTVNTAITPSNEEPNVPPTT